jgi:hypothetical protein
LGLRRLPPLLVWVLLYLLLLLLLLWQHRVHICDDAVPPAYLPQPIST